MANGERGARLIGLIWLLAGAAFITVGDARADEASLQSLSSCMRANIPQTLQLKQLTLTTKDANGQGRTIKGRLFAQRDNGLLRTMLKLDAPSDLRGAAYLLREGRDEADSMYMFLPAINKTRRILGGSQHNPLFGTDISYADIKQISLAFGTGKVLMEAQQQLQARPAHVVLVHPDARQESPYSAIRAWVDVKTCVALKAEFMVGQEVRKRYSALPADLKQSGSHWYVARSTIEDLVSHSRTELVIDSVVSNLSLSDNYFNPHSFQLSN